MSSNFTTFTTPEAPENRIILALDVPAADDARRLIARFEAQISFYKVGLELLMAGGLESLLRDLVRDGRRVFVDLKLPNDIPTTVRRTVELAASVGVSLLTLSNSVTRETIEAAVSGRGERPSPKLLFVPHLSSQDRSDLAAHHGHSEADFERFMEERTAFAKQAGADGFIVSGQEIALLRRLHPEALLVSPGIRPTWAPKDDHKRACTPGEAIRLGADYLVIGRPIRDAADPEDCVRRIIEEIGEALSEKAARSA